MKKSLLTAMIFCVVMIFALPMYAALSDYTFSQSTAAYTEITGGTSLGATDTDDQRFVDPAVPAGGTTYTGIGFPIGFNFTFNDATFDVIGINANGWIAFGQTALGATAVDMNTTSAYTPLSTTTAISPAQLTNRVAALGIDLQAQTGASIRIETIGTAPNRICVIQWKNYKKYGTSGTGDNFNFQIQLQENLNKVAFAYGAFTVNATAGTPQVGMRGPLATDFASRTTTTDWQATTAATTNAATCALAAAIYPANGLNLVYSPPPVVDNDLQAVSITGPTGPSANTPVAYTITVRNRGSISQSSYSVKLMSGTTELATVAGPTIGAGEIVPVVVNYTFTSQGPVTIFGKILFAGDQNNLNNETSGLLVTVQAPGSQVVEIGTGTLTQRQPFGVYWGFERDASLYLANEINLMGVVTAAKWYCGSAQPAAAPYKIYLKTTTETALTAVPWATMIDGATLMQEGTYTFSTTGWATFTFATPFSYTNGNLIVMVETAYTGTGISPYPMFNYSTAAAGTHQYWYQDTSAPTGNGTLNTSRPNIGLFFVTSGFGSLTGTVTNGATPLAGATVAVVGTQLTQVTGAAGTYSFPFVTVGPHQVSCNIVGFNPQTLPVTVVENTPTTLNFPMVQLPVVNVTGHVVGSDNPGVGLVEATIALTGMAPYTATTNASGDFTITGVYASQTYGYTVTKAGFSPATGNITVGTTNYSMGTITVNEMAYPPSGVQAVEAGANVNVTWTAPNPNVQNFEDGFETYTDFSLTFDPWISTDVDLSETYAYTGYNWGDNQFQPQAFMVFNPSTVTPAFTADIMTTHAGSKMLSCWASTTPPNNDWVISPSVTVPANGVVSFWARSLTDEYGLERFKVGVSTTGTAPADFTIISGTTYIQAPVDWTQYTYQLSAYVGQSVHIGVQCISSDAFCFFIDDFFIGVPTTSRYLSVGSVTNPMMNLGHVAANAKQISTNVVRSRNINNENVVRASFANQTTTNGSRSLLGYKVWRLLDGQETNEAAWTLLTPNAITATAYADAGWSGVSDGFYKWAVKAVYTGNVLSTPAINATALHKFTQVGTISGVVRNASNQPVSGATITAGTFTANSNTTGAYTMQVGQGTYTVTCSKPTFQTATQTGVVVVTGQTTVVNFALQPSSEITDDFESYTDFAIDFAPWTNVDVDLSSTYSYQGYTWENAQVEQAFQIFNPTTTTPNSVGVIGTAHSGNKMVHCWAAPLPAAGGNGPNNDWLISLPIITGGHFSIWAKSMSADYPAEKLSVGISTTGTAPANFTIISGAQPITTTTTWTQYPFDITSYVGQTIRVGFHCTSNDQFALQMDDFVYDVSTAVDDPTPEIIVTGLNNNYPNPFNPETTVSYSVNGKQPVVVEIYNTKGQKVKTLVNETKATGKYTVKWNGTNDNNQKVTSGVYFYKMTAGNHSSSRKMIMMK